MAKYLMHMAMGRATILSSDEVIEEAAQALKDLDSSEYKKEELVAEFVMLMNAAFSTGKVGQAKEPSVDEIRRVIAAAFMLTRASTSGRA